MDKKRSESAAPTSRFKVEEENLEVRVKNQREENKRVEIGGLATPF